MTRKDLERGQPEEAFSAVAFKTLSSVETNPKNSNQHEFNGSRALQDLFGSKGPQHIPTDFVWMADNGEFVREPGLDRTKTRTDSGYERGHSGGKVIVFIMSVTR